MRRCTENMSAEEVVRNTVEVGVGLGVYIVHSHTESWAVGQVVRKAVDAAVEELVRRCDTENTSAGEVVRNMVEVGADIVHNHTESWVVEQVVQKAVDTALEELVRT